ncbi:MAG: hypothetical protein Q9195_008937 [Heterodermia aff. obscurata]
MHCAYSKLSWLAHTNRIAPRRHIIVGITQDIRATLRLEAEISKGVPPLPLLLPSLSCELEAEAFALEDVEELAAFAVFDPKPDNCDWVRVAAEFRVGSATWVCEVVIDELVVDTAEEKAIEITTEEATVCVLFCLVVEACVWVDWAVVLTTVSEADAAVALCELCPPLFPPDSPLRTFGQSVVTPVWLKNMPIRVSGYALVPLHCVLIETDTPSNCSTQSIEHALPGAWLVNSFSVQCVRGVL